MNGLVHDLVVVAFIVAMVTGPALALDCRDRRRERARAQALHPSNHRTVGDARCIPIRCPRCGESAGDAYLTVCGTNMGGWIGLRRHECAKTWVST